MSVLECDRNQCDNIMCGRLSDEHGYLCDECFDELVSSGPCTDVEYFMSTIKKSDNYDESFARYNAVFEQTD